MAWERQPVSVEYDDDDILDRAVAGSVQACGAQYPSGLCFSIACSDLEKCGCESGDPGDVTRFSAMATVTAISRGMDDCRIELEICKLAGPDGKFCELANPAHICLTDAELKKLELDSDCERGDTIHLIGTMRLEREYKSEYGETATLQIIELTYEDESAEVRK